jgi:diguanylate cyclase (GGDEF)-like protein
MIPALIGVGIAGCGRRILLTQSFHQARARQPISVEQAVRWEQRLALASFVSAMAAGGLQLCCAWASDPSAELVSIVLTYSYAAGLVIRFFVRPVIAIGSLMLAVLPTTLIWVAAPNGAHAILAVVSLCLILAGREAISHLYQITVEQLDLRFELAQHAERDALTGLLNRRGIRQILAGEAAKASAGIADFAVLLIDLDKFKAANDRFGHKTGDRLLCEVSARLLAVAGPNDAVARVGGDEFVVLQRGASRPEESELIARRIVTTVSAPYHFDELQLSIGASVGVALSQLDGFDIDHLLACADEAMYRSKTRALGFCISTGATTRPEPSRSSAEPLHAAM